MEEQMQNSFPTCPHCGSDPLELRVAFLALAGMRLAAFHCAIANCRACIQLSMVGYAVEDDTRIVTPSSGLVV
jgi:hypothetical protein